jgi:hypothetical protein
MDRLVVSTPDYWREKMGAAMLRVTRKQIGEHEAAGLECEALRGFLGDLERHYGHAQPPKPKPQLRLIHGGKRE